MAKDPKHKFGVKKIEDLLLTATEKYLEPLGVKEQPVDVEQSWIDFKKWEEESQLALQNSQSDSQSSQVPETPTPTASISAATNGSSIIA